MTAWPASSSNRRRSPSPSWATRITNLALPPPHRNAAKIAYYREEAQLILDALGGASPFFAAQSADRIRSYPLGAPTKTVP
jgi:hypothetical protein